MRTIPVALLLLSLMAILTCNKDDTLNQDAGKEIARIFLLGQTTDMDVEEVRGDSDNRITCKFVETLDMIQVIVLDANNRRFQMEFDNIQDDIGVRIINGFAEYTAQNGITYKTIGSNPALMEVVVSWRRNFDICEFTWGANPNPVELRSKSGSSIFIDSLKIETLREDDL